MDWQKLQQTGNKLFNSSSIVVPFHILATTLLSLLLPLSFALLSRLSIANFLLSSVPSSHTAPCTFPTFLLFHMIPSIFHALVSLLSSLTLIHNLTGRINLNNRPPEPIFNIPLYMSWLLLCIFQVCVGIGIEAGFKICLNDLHISREISLVSRTVFFLGLHETMTYWSRNVVKPVVDDTILGFRKEERSPERAAVAMGFGGVWWWWRLKGGAETLVIMVKMKKELNMGVGLGDIVGWWLYYITVIIGMLKIAKLILWFAIILLFERVELNPSIESSSEIDHKV